MSEWIEIKNGLPKYKQTVLIICGGTYQEVAVYRPDNLTNRWECHNGYKAHDVSHWKPLDWPAPPVPQGREHKLVADSPTFAYSLAMFLTRNGRRGNAPEMQAEVEMFMKDRSKSVVATEE